MWGDSSNPATIVMLWTAGRPIFSEKRKEKMELVESIEVLNQRLLDTYGKFNDQPIWRIMWSEDQFEHRKGAFNYFDANGNFLRTEVGIHHVPKYRQWIKEKFVLERIMPVPEINRDELVTELSYEPVFVFERGNGDYLPPQWDVCVVVIESILKEAARATGNKYHPKYKEKNESPEEYKQRINKLQKDLFANETTTTDSMGYKEAIVVPHVPTDIPSSKID